MRANKILSIVSMVIATIFVTISLLVNPLWNDIHTYLGIGTLPLMQTLIVLGMFYFAYCYRIHRREALTGERSWVNFSVMVLVDLIMVTLLVILVKELGYENVVIVRNAGIYLPVVAWVAAAVLLIWFGPLWQPFKDGRTRAVFIVVLGLMAAIWFSLPWKVEFTSRPVVFMQQDGITVNWGTNLLATSQLSNGPTPEMDQLIIPQTNGLIDAGDRLQRVFLARDSFEENLYFQAHSQGIRKINPTSAVTAGEADSERIHVGFPAPNDEIFLVAFSDIHEQTQIYEQQAQQIPWRQVDYAIFLGDFLNHVGEPEQVQKALLDLPTGGLDLPRVFVRGNHEARGDNARALSDWLLPAGGKWYYTFSSGDVFFVVLDSGEDKEDSNFEYAGLINFTAYHQEQALWLAEAFASPDYQNAKYRVVVVHIPPFPTFFPTTSFEPVQALLENQADIDLVMSGHIHSGGIWLPGETGLPFPVTTCGGPLGVDTAAVTVSLTSEGIQLEVIDIFGKVVESAWVPAE